MNKNNDNIIKLLWYWYSNDFNYTIPDVDFLSLSMQNTKT